MSTSETPTPDEMVLSFTVPPGQVGFVGSPGEFLRAQRFGPVDSFISAQTLPTGDGRRELRLFLLPPGVALRTVARVPGFNIRVLPAGTEIMVRLARSALDIPDD